jgi:hypothetical protein
MDLTLLGIKEIGSVRESPSVLESHRTLRPLRRPRLSAMLRRLDDMNSKAHLVGDPCRSCWHQSSASLLFFLTHVNIRRRRRLKVVVRFIEFSACRNSIIWGCYRGPGATVLMERYLFSDSYGVSAPLPRLGPFITKYSGGWAVIGEQCQSDRRRGSLLDRPRPPMLIHIGRGESRIGRVDLDSKTS